MGDGISSRVAPATRWWGIIPLTIAMSSSVPSGDRTCPAVQPQSAPSVEQRPAAAGRSCDFSRSFVTFVTKARANNARIQIEARCAILDRQNDRTEEFFLIASCKGEDTYGKGPLFREPSYDFCGIFSNTEFRLIRRHSNHQRDNETVDAIADRFETVRIDVRLVDGEVLADNRQIVRATLTNRPLNGRVRVTDVSGRYEATIEFPIKTMNVNDIQMAYQVDTGPILLPNWEADKKRSVERFDLAFVAYNKPEEAHFVIQVPTPVVDGRVDGPMVSHYSKTTRATARCDVIALR